VRQPVLPRIGAIRKMTNEAGHALVLSGWRQSFLDAYESGKFLMFLLSLTRQDGKSTLCGALAAAEMLCVPGAFVLMVAAGLKQQETLFERRLRAPLMRAIPIDQRKSVGLKFTKHGAVCESLGSQIEVVASVSDTSTGRTPTLLVVDECRDVSDDVFSALAPSVIGASGRIVLASSAGRPAGFFYSLLGSTDGATWVHRSNVNTNPCAQQSVIDWLRTKLALVSPVAAQRELSNEFAEDGESLLPSSLIDGCIDDRLGEMPRSDLQAWCFADLSRKHDLTSVVVVVRDEPRRPEAQDHLIAASIRTWNPKECPGEQVPFDEVRAYIRNLADRFPNLEAIRVDEGAEAGAVMPALKADPRLSLITEGFIASLKSNMELWSALTARLHSQTLSIPRDERLIAELRGLRREEFALGSKWRVVDSSRKLHRDVSVALAGAVMLAGDLDATPLMLVSSRSDSAYQQWLMRSGSTPTPQPEPEVIEATDEEMAARPDADEWERVPEEAFMPMSERRRQHHANVNEIARRDGFWSPEVPS
jgi:hypothetical protein